MIVAEAPGGVLGAALTLTLLMLVIALACAAWRLLRGPTLADRVVALDLVSMLLVVFLVVFTLVTETKAYSFVAIGLALIAFLATVAFARYLERAEERDE
jgi:multicomponent Na+:H+ antiporter subunit F